MAHVLVDCTSGGVRVAAADRVEELLVSGYGHVRQCSFWTVTNLNSWAIMWLLSNNPILLVDC